VDGEEDEDGEDEDEDEVEEEEEEEGDGDASSTVGKSPYGQFSNRSVYLRRFSVERNGRSRRG
jgi:hypothetical protein